MFTRNSLEIFVDPVLEFDDKTLYALYSEQPHVLRHFQAVVEL